MSEKYSVRLKNGWDLAFSVYEKTQDGKYKYSEINILKNQSPGDFLFESEDDIYKMLECLKDIIETFGIPNVGDWFIDFDTPVEIADRAFIHWKKELLIGLCFDE